MPAPPHEWSGKPRTSALIAGVSYLSDRKIIYTLLTRPDALAWIRDNRDKLPHAVEESLRHIPFRHGVGIPRVATQDIEIEAVGICGTTPHHDWPTGSTSPPPAAQEGAMASTLIWRRSHSGYVMPSGAIPP